MGPETAKGEPPSLHLPSTCQGDQPKVGQKNKRGYEGSGDRGGDSLGTISHIKLDQGAFRGNPPVSLVPPVSLLVVCPEKGQRRSIQAKPGLNGARVCDGMHL